MEELYYVKLVLKLVFIFFYWFAYCCNKYRDFFHWGTSIKILLEWIITYVQNCWNYIKIYFSCMYIVCLVKYIGFCELLEIISSPLTADGKVDHSMFLSSNCQQGSFPFWVPFFIVFITHIFMYAFSLYLIQIVCV